MKRLLLSTLSIAVITAGATTIAAQAEISDGDSDWSTCFNACQAAGYSYDFCRMDCQVFEPRPEQEISQ